MKNIKQEIGALFNSIKYPQEKTISSSTTDQTLIGFNEGWNAHREAMFSILSKIYDLLDEVNKPTQSKPEK